MPRVGQAAGEAGVLRAEVMLLQRLRLRPLLAAMPATAKGDRAAVLPRRRIWQSSRLCWQVGSSTVTRLLPAITGSPGRTSPGIQPAPWSRARRREPWIRGRTRTSISAPAAVRGICTCTRARMGLSGGAAIIHAVRLPLMIIREHHSLIDIGEKRNERSKGFCGIGHQRTLM